MLRSSMDCHFQLYLPDSKILQFRTESPDKQAQWMALIKVGLGRGETGGMGWAGFRGWLQMCRCGYVCLLVISSL